MLDFFLAICILYKHFRIDNCYLKKFKIFRLLHLSKPGVSTGIVPTAAAAAASLMSDGGGTAL